MKDSNPSKWRREDKEILCKGFPVLRVFSRSRVVHPPPAAAIPSSFDGEQLDAFVDVPEGDRSVQLGRREQFAVRRERTREHVGLVREDFLSVLPLEQVPDSGGFVPRNGREKRIRGAERETTNGTFVTAYGVDALPRLDGPVGV